MNEKDILDYFEEGDQPASEESPEPVTEATPSAQPAETPAEEPFTDRVDPATLPDELKPIYKSLQADYTRKTQALAQERKAMEALKAQPPAPAPQEAAPDWEPEFSQYFTQAAGYEEPTSTDASAFDYEETDDPILAEVRQLRAKLEQQERWQQQAERARQYQEAQQQALSHVNQMAAQVGVSPAEVFSVIQQVKLAPWIPEQVQFAAILAKLAANPQLLPTNPPETPSDVTPSGSRQRVETINDLDISPDDDIYDIYAKAQNRGIKL